jgi:hypothetical protein
MKSKRLNPQSIVLTWFLSWNKLEQQPWYCSNLKLLECHDPARPPVDDVQIDTLHMSGMGLENLHQEAARRVCCFSRQPGHMGAYPAKSAEMAYDAKN